MEAERKDSLFLTLVAPLKSFETLKQPNNPTTVNRLRFNIGIIWLLNVSEMSNQVQLNRYCVSNYSLQIRFLILGLILISYYIHVYIYIHIHIHVLCFIH